ncbi:MAG: epoxyqueuosine reductase QueH [Alphaproteobacteria bacterium]|uniref:Epoxyqueuosine reductase QueH n=1 Tax=Candidatus Nitrobium versatile TaxID=2884831 RepID=A0A953LX62_9BACT|nr:epoxyqueuosine reductase QueH [Candidatus Nitrobium versatile]
MKLLMHLCCAPCAVYPLQAVRKRGIEVAGFWFNPNIHPVTEYRSRLDALKELQDLWNLDIAYRDEYGLKEYLRNVVGHEENRCGYCYTVRLEETARTARETGADAFTTSLLVSPYQKFDMIVEAGKAMQERYSVEFFAEDFRDGFREGRRISGEMNLYRQKYCGCIYSEMERYSRTKR